MGRKDAARFMWGYPVLCLLFLCSCGGPIHHGLGANTAAVEDFRTAQKYPEESKGMYLVAGGQIVEARVEAEGIVLIVLEQPLGFRQRPRRDGPSAGRFVVWYGDYLDPYLFRIGSYVTVGGVIGGTRGESRGDQMHPHLLLHAEEIHLWREEDWSLLPKVCGGKEWYPRWYDPYYGTRPWWW